MEQVKATTGYQWAKRTTTNRLYAELASKPKRNKYGAKKVKLDGYTFDSKREATVYSEYRLLERAGQIRALSRQPVFTLYVRDVEITRYTADFSYYDKAEKLHVIDVKSKATAARRDFKLVKKLMKAVHGIEVEVIT